MIYLDDYEIIRKHFRNSDLKVIRDSELAFLVIESLAKKSYYSAEGVVSYTDGTPAYRLFTCTDRLGYTDLGVHLRERILDRVSSLYGCYLSLKFKFAHRGEVSRNFSARDVALYYSRTNGCLYMTDSAERCLFLPDCLGRLDDRILDTNIRDKIVRVSLDSGVQNSQGVIDHCIEWFNSYPSSIIRFNSDLCVTPASGRLQLIVPSVDESNSQRSVAAVLLDGTAVALTGTEVYTNYTQGNPLTIEWIYHSFIEGVSRVSWDGKIVEAMATSSDTVSFVKSCIPPNVVVESGPRDSKLSINKIHLE